MDRRRFLEVALGASAGVFLGRGRVVAGPPAVGLDPRRDGGPQEAGGEAESPGPPCSIARPTSAQIAWQQAELGVIFHYDLHVFDGRRYSRSRNRRAPIEDPDIFGPPSYDIDQWVEAAGAMRARFALLTASHETGFRLWQSDANPYCMKILRWRGGKDDLVADFVADEAPGVK